MKLIANLLDKFSEAISKDVYHDPFKRSIGIQIGEYHWYALRNYIYENWMTEYYKAWESLNKETQEHISKIKELTDKLAETQHELTAEIETLNNKLKDNL